MNQLLKFEGTGKPLKNFIHAQTWQMLVSFLMENYNEKGFLNIGSGKEISIKDLALLIKDIVVLKERYISIQKSLMEHLEN